MNGRLWWAWTIGLLAAAGGLMLGAAAWLDDASIGAASFGGGEAAGCDSSLVGGLTLLAAAGAALAAATASVDRRMPGAVIVWDWARLAFALPIPAAGLALTAPGMLGCASAGRIEQLGSLGESLLGTPGAAIGAASALALGAALVAGLRVDRPVDAMYFEGGAGEYDPAALIVERALEEAEAVEGSEELGRFRGVDS